MTITMGAQLVGPGEGGTWVLGPGYRILVWLCRVREGTLQPLEDHDELRWLTRDELYAVPWLPADLPILAALEARMSSPGLGGGMVWGRPNP